MAWALLALVTPLLAGCFGIPKKPDPEPKVVNRFVEIPAELLVKCELAAPPTRAQYLAATTAQEREKILTDYGLAQTTAASKCASTIQKTTEWNAKQKKIYAAPK